MNSLDSYGNTLAKHHALLSQRTHCDLCNDTLLRHVRHQQLCWFCPTCRHDTSPLQVHSPSQADSYPAKAAFSRKLSVVKSRLASAKQTAKTESTAPAA